jgi:hypothetical protein
VRRALEQLLLGFEPIVERATVLAAAGDVQLVGTRRDAFAVDVRGGRVSRVLRGRGFDGFLDRVGRRRTVENVGGLLLGHIVSRSSR